MCVRPMMRIRCGILEMFLCVVEISWELVELRVALTGT